MSSSTVTPEPGSRYIDEDVSCLEHGGRILALAEDESVGVAERVRLLVAAGRALDEFFEFRGVRLRTVAAGGPQKGRAVRTRARQLLERQSQLFRRLGPALAGEGVILCDWEVLTEAERRALGEVFGERLLPVLAPLATEPGRPLPAPATRSLNLAVSVTDHDGRRRFGSVELPPVLERFVAVPPVTHPRLTEAGRRRFVPVEAVVRAHVGELFAAFDVTHHGLFRLTRQVGVAARADDQDMLASTESQLGWERSGVPVRLEVEHRINDELLARLAGEFDLTDHDVYPVRGMLGLSDLSDLSEVADGGGSGSLFRLGRMARAHRELSAGECEHPFTPVETCDRLVHQPYDHTGISVADFLGRAARDTRVLAIKQTLFRPHPASPVVRALVRAAERGTHVVALVELGARGSEREAVACARMLDRAGAHVVYGLVGLRIHCSVTLVVTAEPASGRAGRGSEPEARVQRFSLVRTGPHGPDRGAESLEFLSADAVLAADLADLFNYLTGYSRPVGFRKLLVGPAGLRTPLLDLVRAQAAAGADGRISLKVSRLVDRELLDALYAASARGTRIEAVVAGACALRPGVAGLSEGIRVVAPSGKLPEGSRCFAFGSGQDRRWYLTSADLAARNLDRQVDVAVPVDDAVCADRLGELFDAAVAHAAWELGPDGSWRRRGPGAETALAALAERATPSGYAAFAAQ
ncbi:MAG: RNA degradosome polyphosphate kinase [Acidimicrobiia bacterium]